MSLLFKLLAIGSFAAALVCGAALTYAAPLGAMQGHLKIISPKPVELADENSATETVPKYAENYADYPLLIPSRDGQKEITRVTADANGNYRVMLPPGDYILDVQGRATKQVRAKQRQFTSHL